MPLDAPPVTFVIAAKNAGRTIASSVQSVLGQRYGGAVRVVVTDDGSTDATPEVLRQFGSAVKVIRVADSSGRSAARNRAIEAVGTPLIAIQDADDISEPERLANTVPLLSGRVGVAGGQVHYFNDLDGTWQSPRWATEPEAIRAGLFAGRMAIAHPTVVMRTDLVRSVGGYDESIPFTEDLDLMLRLAKNTDFAATTNFVVKYRYSRRNAFNYLWQTELWRRRVMVKNGIGSARGLGTLAVLSTLREFGRESLASPSRRAK